MKPPYPSYVSEWHNAPYSAISPTLPAHSHAGQTVVVTGGGSGIGQATALAYAAAGAARIVLIGRRVEKLAETKAKVAAQASKAAVETYAASVTSVAELKTGDERDWLGRAHHVRREYRPVGEYCG